MKFPDKFPEGCSFAADFSGDDWVKFPDGAWFKLDDASGDLLPSNGFNGKGTSSNEAFFRKAAASARDRAAAAPSR